METTGVSDRRPALSAGVARPRTAAPRTATTEPAIDEEFEWDEEDDDPGMFSFLPPELSPSPAAPASVAEVAHVSIPFSLPAPSILTPPGVRHQYNTPLHPNVTESSETTRLSPAAAYALAVADDGPRKRSAWVQPESPSSFQQDHLKNHPIGGIAVDFPGQRRSTGTVQTESTDWVGDIGESISMHHLSSRKLVNDEQVKDEDRQPTGTTDLPYEYGHLEEEEDSPYPEVRASVSNLDDPEMPVLTFRAWFLGLVFGCLGGAVNAFLNFRYPAPTVFPIVTQVLAYPVGKFLALVLPTTTWRVPEFLIRRGFDETCSLNPGPFNIKEHTVILLIANTATSIAVPLNYSVILRLFFREDKGYGYDLVLLLGNVLVGFGFAGVGRRFLVWPASQIWPQDLVYCTLLNTLHAEEYDGDEGGRQGTSRFRFFVYIFTGAFLWYFVPGYLFQALSAFSFICWAAPNNVVLNQLFGVYSGLGMSGLTFDWSQISYIVSPLIVPWWGSVNIFVGFVLAYWIMSPIMYYANVWYTAYLPLSTGGIFDRFGQPYDTSRVVTPNYQLDVAGYEAYSPLYLPITYVTVYGLCFALATAVVVHTAIYHGKTMWRQIKNRTLPEEEDVHAKLMRSYPETPDSWYWIFLLISLALSICSATAWDSGLPVWALLISIGMGFLYYLPAGYIYAASSQLVTINLIIELVAGYLLPGNYRGNMLFKMFAIVPNSFAISFVQDLKLGHYMKIPPRTTFWVQIVGMTFSCLVQFGVTEFLVTHVSDLCSAHQAALLTCPFIETFNSGGIIWGLIGPARNFGISQIYNPVLWWFLVGALLPILFWRLECHFPNVVWLRYVNIPVLLTGATFVPPASGINYSSYFLVAALFQYWMRRRHFNWWSKFNFVLSAGLDAGTAICTLLIFFALQLPKEGTIALNWWGNEVFADTADYKGVPYKIPPATGFGPSIW